MKNIITNNLGMKISALLISVLLWFFVTSRGQSEMSLEVPIEFKNIPIGLGIVSSSNKTVSLNIKGQERLMKNITSSNIRVTVDLSKAKKGDGLFYVNKDDIKLPYTMSVTAVSPSSLKVRTDETVTKVVPITPVLTGNPENGFIVKSTEVNPSSVTVKGLKTEVRKISDLRTEALDITGLSETTAQDVDIDTLGANINLNTTSVKVKVIIAGRKK